MPEPHSASSAAIELRSVSRQYQMGETIVRAVDQVSFAIPRGDFAALLGPSGSGKSTLLNLIAGLDRPTSGAIVVDGRDLATMSSEELARYRRNTVGMIFQSFNLVPSMTLAENVELPMRFAEVDRAERSQRAMELLTKVGLASRADHRPSQLSGGEQQRGAIARALVNRPTLLLADEPTGNLDSRTGQEIMDLIVELNSTLGVTIVMVTHEQSLADHYSRRALHMADGKLANVIEEVEAVKSYDLLDLAVRNIRNSRLRNFLTTVGIGVGVASLVAMLSLGIGLQNLANKRLKKSGIFETIFVTSRSDFRNAERQQDEEKPEEAPPLDETARREIEKLPNVAEVVPEIRAMGEIEYAGKTHASFVAALPPSSKDDEGLASLKGKFFSSPTANEVIVQQDFAKRLDPTGNLIGKDIVVRYAERRSTTDDPSGGGFSITRTERTFRVVGIIEEEPFGGMRMISRARLFLPTATAESMNLMQMADTQQMMRAGANARVYTMLTVRVKNSSQAEQVQDAIKKMKFGTYSFLDATKGIRRFFAILDGFLGIFGSLALAVASLAIVNTLVMAVLERRREIGIMKALGASDADIKKIFFAEAAAMGAAGGVLGVLLGWGIGRVINAGTNFWLARNKLPAENFWFVPWWLVLSAIIFAIGVSILSGLYPASRAAKLDPVQALRYE